MLFAEISPVFVTIFVAAAAVVAVANIWVFKTLHDMKCLHVRVIDALGEMNVAVARLEQAVQASNPSASDMRAAAASLSRSMRRPGVDIESLLSGTPAMDSLPEKTI